MKSFNHVVLVGHVGKEPALRTVTTEKHEEVKVSQFSLAVDEGQTWPRPPLPLCGGKPTVSRLQVYDT